ncbi:MAG TPA: hypothetical protein VJS42_03275 [Steroidobacteraceae bacterium]|nr:hypothetical protein [Steroidobacteraceae bacterium]
MKIRAVILGAVSVLAAACATGYQSATNPLVGWMGGYWDKKSPGDLIKVGFAGNGFIDPHKAGVYLLYRCAEVAQREHKEYFLLYENLPAAIADRRSTEKTVTTITGKPTIYAYILLLDQPEGPVLSAPDLITRLKPEVKPEDKS